MSNLIYNILIVCGKGALQAHGKAGQDYYVSREAKK